MNSKSNYTAPKELISIKPNKDGKYVLPLNLLPLLQIRTPAGFEDLGTNVVVQFLSSGMTDVGLSEKTGNLLPITDLTRLAGARGVITGATKLLDKEARNETLTKLLFESGVTETTIHSSPNLKAEMNQIAKYFDNLAASKVSIEANVASLTTDKYRVILDAQIKATEAVIAEMVRETALGTREKTPLETLLVKHGTCKYIWNRIANIRLNHAPTLSLEYLFYPARIENGLALTSSELLDESLLKNLDVSEENEIFRALIKDPEIFGKFALIRPETKEADELRAKRFAWVLIPNISRSELIKTRRLTLAPKAGSNAIMATLVENIHQLKMGIAPLGIPINEFLAQTVKYVYDGKSAIGVVDQALAAMALDAENDLWNKIIESPKLIADKLLFIGGLPRPLTALIHKMQEFPKNTGVIKLTTKSTFFTNRKIEADLAVWKSKIPALSEIYAKKKAKDKNSVFGILSGKAKAFLNDIRKETDNPLHPHYARVAIYLKQFSNERFQNVAVRALQSAAEQISVEIQNGEYSFEAEDYLDSEE